MKMRKTIIGALALLATAITSSAAVQNITVESTSGNFLQNGTEPDGVLSLASNQFYSSFQSPASTSNSPTANYNFLAGVVENWNANRTPTMPDVVPTVALDVGSISGNSETYNTVAGYDYVVFHFGNGPAGAGGGPKNADENGWWQAWYLGGASHTFSLPQEGDPLKKVGGFSSARYFNGTPPTNKVPDSGSTIIALGVGLLGLGGVRRFLIKA